MYFVCGTKNKVLLQIVILNIFPTYFSRYMRNAFLVLAGFGVGLSLFFFASFKSKNTIASREYVVIDALESMVSGGIGRSKGVITYSDGKQEEFELENFYSMAGVNFGNIKGNDKTIITKINQLAKQGYRIVSHSTGGTGIYCSRIILEKAE
jgi:hypothetical protein